MDWLTAPYHYAFMRMALAAACLVGLTCALLGVHVVHRRMAFMGDALAHATLPGLAVAYALGQPLSLGALGAALVAALLIARASRRREVGEDAAIGVVFTGMFSLGVVLLSQQPGYRDLTHLLFGSVLGVTWADLAGTGATFAAVALFLRLFHKELELTAYDPAHAAAIGIKPERMRALLLVLIALAVVAGIRSVGVILTSAMLVTPAATGALLSKRMAGQMGWACSLALVACVAGLTLTFAVEKVPSGAAIVLCSAGLFATASGCIRIRR